MKIVVITASVVMIRGPGKGVNRVGVWAVELFEAEFGLRRLAATPLKRHPSKERIACKRLQAWDTDFLEEILRGSENLERV
jgi:hypothetical protein